MTDKHFCEKCGARLDARWERLSPGLVRSLMKFGRAVWEQQNYKLHVTKDISDPVNKMTHNEHANFQKLRFHGLIAKDTNEDGERVRDGYWILTKRGNMFLKNKLAVPRRVLVNRNKVIGHDPEEVDIGDFRGKIPEFDRQFEYTVVDGSIVSDAKVRPPIGQGALL